MKRETLKTIGQAILFIGGLLLLQIDIERIFF